MTLGLDAEWTADVHPLEVSNDLATDCGTPQSAETAGTTAMQEAARTSSGQGSSVLGFSGSAVHVSANWLSSPKVLALTVFGCLGTYFLGLMISIAISRAFLTDRRAQERSEPPAAPARIVAASGCRWEDRSPRADNVAVLPAGTSHLVAGVVELEFDGGARVSIEGPAEFAPRSGWRMELTVGRLTAYVPKRRRFHRRHTLGRSHRLGHRVRGRGRSARLGRGSGLSRHGGDGGRAVAHDRGQTGRPYASQ